MPNYDFAELSPLDFEQLINDLVQAKVGVRVERFGPGSDGGIDGRYALLDGESVVQAKHYKNSTFSNLTRSLVKSKSQIVELNPKRYIICTSQSLTPERKKEIIEKLSPIKVKKEDVWGKEDLNSILMEFPEIEKSHIKLWLNSSSVLERIVNADIYNRTEVCMHAMRRAAQLFVSYDGYAKADDIISKNSILIITGPPGVGKTTLSLIVAAKHLEEGWEVVNISNIRQAYTVMNPEKKQIVLFDDFLGSIRLDRDSLSKEDSDFRKFFAFIKSNRSTKKFILTSRGYIYKEAKFLSDTFSDRGGLISDLVLNIKNYTDEIRVKILYNHLYFSDLERPYLEAILKSNVIDKIISHKNYMPRLVEWLTDPVRLYDIKPEEYAKHIIKTLDKPDEIWQKAVEEHLEPSPRLLLHCLFFLYGFRKLDKSYAAWFEEALSYLAAKQNFQIRDHELAKALKAIEGSFVEINGRSINYVNPSLQDYINDSLFKSASLEALSCTCRTRDQVILVWKYVKRIKSERQVKLKRICKNLSDRCLLEDSSISGSVPLHDYLQFSKGVSECLGDPDLLEQAISEEKLNQLDLDAVNLPSVFKDLSKGEYIIRSQNKLRSYLSERLISHLQEEEFEQEDAVALLEAAERHITYMNSREKIALSKMADSVISNIIPLGSNEDEDTLTTILDEYKVLEHWGSDNGYLDTFKNSIDNSLRDIYEYRQNQKMDRDEHHMDSSIYSIKNPPRSIGGISKTASLHKESYRDLFSSILPPEDD
jgi:adenylate kinase family enzyme